MNRYSGSNVWLTAFAAIIELTGSAPTSIAFANLDGRARSSVRVTFISRFASAGRFCIRRKSTGTFGNRARWQVVASMRLGLRIDPAR
jgi:hypothetical protein